ncbi:hypothetical protein D8Y22_06150 [Salinadaptatus halalkaliphilus]|uniref:Uncharacterized protein n=1 Tax=Salinadaptatus halalkaliphilus TaxID=2419781 RepID=A0A4S3TSY0_9EURY|nr:hypothetical protein [Salinadaptatus halalkaliphilus]THE65748.1 hypothetical protein D8Y22_06150 [Salinadaptatus halalkaliphilus]
MSRSVTDAVLVLVAVGTLALGGLLATAPTMLPPTVLETVEGIESAVDTDRALLAIGLVVALFAVWRAYFSGADDVHDPGIEGEATARESNVGGAKTPRDAIESEQPRDPTAGTALEEPATAGSDTVAIVGQRTTDRIEGTIASLQRGDEADTNAVREELRATLRTVETARGRSRQAAADRVRRGAWTDDRVAAVFLGDDAAGTLSIWHRLRRWLFPGRTFDRRLERTLAELEAYAATPANGAVTRTGGHGDESDGTRPEGDAVANAVDPTEVDHA